MAAPCKINFQDLPNLTGCPADNELILFGNSSGGLGSKKLGWRTYSDVVNCLIGNIFGTGAKVITGSQLDVDGKYFNSDFINNLLVFAENIPNFLNNPNQWGYLYDGGGNVNGIQILIGYDPADIFIIFPNPTPV